ncbi:MAG TPA: YHS domain-containing protein, partial [Nitrospira sp.]|nr:YHS domain-containing protein [Nitrospira sp.]
MAIDPICGMTVDPDNAAVKHEHNGQTYYFCSEHCVAKFKENPAKYGKANSAKNG